MQLFCLTHAGGTAAFFNQLDAYINNEIELVKLEYSGHGKRTKEGFYNNFNELASDMYEAIRRAKNNNEEYALIGYSMGSISLVEVLKLIIQKKELPLPKCVFLSAHEPISKKEINGLNVLFSDEVVKQVTIEFGGIPTSLTNNATFWRTYLPLYRNDYKMICEYNFDSISLETFIPAVFFYSPTDTNVENMKLWEKYFKGENEFVEYKGNHFFIQKYSEDMCGIINRRLLHT